MKQPALLPRVHLPAFLALLVSSAACRGPGEVPVDPLPFHVALLPIEVEVSAPDGTEALATAEDELRLDLDAERLGDALVRELEGSTFTRVTVLRALDDDAADRSRPERELELQRVAYAQGADLIVRAKLVYDPAVRAHINEKFWLNFPLFALGGPFCYFIDDRSYDASAKLQAVFFDLSSVHDELDERWMVLELPLLAEFDGIDLDFLDRAESSVPSYVLSFLVPAGLLARGGEAVDGAVEEGALEVLCRDLALKVQEARHQFHRNEVAPFHMDERAARVSCDGSGRLDLDVPLLDPEGRGLRRFSLAADGQVLQRGDLDRESEEDGRTWVRVHGLELPEGTTRVHLQVETSTGIPRGYTFAVPRVPSE